MRIGQKIMNRIIKIVNQNTSFAIPTNIGVCITSKCNLKCTYCMRETYKPQGEIEIKALQKILKNNPWVSGVCIMGLCEPLLHPQIIDLLNLIHSMKKSISLTTNGTIKIDENLLKALQNVDLFCMSIDTTKPKTFKKMRGGANFHTVWNNLVRVITYKRELGLTDTDNPRIQINAVVTKENIYEIKELIEKLKEYKSDIYYLSLEGVSRTDYSKEDPFIISQEEYEEVYSEYKKIIVKSGLRVVGLDYILYPSTGWGNCTLAKFGPFIHPNGEVYFCFDYQRIIGNVFTQQLLAVWNNKKARQFRYELQTDSPPLEQCRYCSFARGGWQIGGTYTKEPKDVKY